jgi:hypothetical protein
LVGSRGMGRVFSSDVQRTSASSRSAAIAALSTRVARRRRSPTRIQRGRDRPPECPSQCLFAAPVGQGQAPIVAAPGSSRIPRTGGWCRAARDCRRQRTRGAPSPPRPAICRPMPDGADRRVGNARTPTPANHNADSVPHRTRPCASRRDGCRRTK